MLDWDLVTELTECTSVGKHTLNGGNKRGDWMKHSLMLQNFTALNTMYRKNPGKQTTYRLPKGNEKQIDCILTKRRYLRYNKDAEANDMIHIGSGRRCVMATFMITAPKKDGHRKKKKTSSRQQNTTKSSQKVEKNRSGSKRSRWSVLRNRGEERCGDGKRSR